MIIPCQTEISIFGTFIQVLFVDREVASTFFQY